MSPSRNAAVLWEQAGETTATSTRAHKTDKVGYCQINLDAFFDPPHQSIPDLYMGTCFMDAILNVYFLSGVY